MNKCSTTDCGSLPFFVAKWGTVPGVAYSAELCPDHARELMERFTEQFGDRAWINLRPRMMPSDALLMDATQ